MATSVRHGRKNDGKRLSIIVLGAPGVGKSTLVNRFVTGMYHEKTWSSVDEIRDKAIYFDRRQITLEIHDMQGTDNTMTEARRAQVSTMASNADGVVLCYAVDSSHSLRVVFDIYKLIWGLRIPEDAPVVLAGLRSDGVLVGKKAVTRLDGMKTVDTLGISRDHLYEVCSRKNKNVTSTFYALVRQILAVHNQARLNHRHSRASRAPSIDSALDANSIVKRSISAPGMQRLARRLSMAPGTQSDLTEMDFVAIPEMTTSVSVNDIMNRWSMNQAGSKKAGMAKTTSMGALNEGTTSDVLSKSSRRQSLSSLSFSVSNKDKSNQGGGRTPKAERKKTSGNTFGRRVSTTSLRQQHQDHLQRRTSSSSLRRTGSSQTSMGLSRNGFKLGGDSSCSMSLSTNEGSSGGSGLCSPLSSGSGATSPDQGPSSEASPRSRNGSVSESMTEGSLSPRIGKSAIERQLTGRQRACSESSLVYNPVRSNQRKTKLREQLRDQLNTQSDGISASRLDTGSMKTDETETVRFSRDYWSSRTDNLSACRLRLTLRHRHSLNDMANASISSNDVKAIVSDNEQKHAPTTSTRSQSGSPSDLLAAVGLMDIVMADGTSKNICISPNASLKGKQDSGISDCDSGSSDDSPSPNVRSQKEAKFATGTRSVPDLASAASPTMSVSRKESTPVMKTARSCATLGTSAEASPSVQLRPGDSGLELEKITVDTCSGVKRAVSEELLKDSAYGKPTMTKSKSSDSNLLAKLKQSLFKVRSKTPKTEKRASTAQPVGQD